MPRGGGGGGRGSNKIPACPPRFLRFTTTPSNELAGKSQQPGLIRSPSRCILKPEILGTITHKELCKNFHFRKNTLIKILFQTNQREVTNALEGN